MQLPLKVWDNGPLEGLDKALENFASQDQRTLAKMNAAIRRLDGEDGPRPVTATDLVYEKQDPEQIHAAFWCPILSNLVFGKNTLPAILRRLRVDSIAYTRINHRPRNGAWACL